MNAPLFRNHNDGRVYDQDNRTMFFVNDPTTADEIVKIVNRNAAQSAQIARLREALEPFANAAQSIESSPLSKHWRDSKQITVGVMVDDVITLGDLRRAARALEVTG